MRRAKILRVGTEKNIPVNPFLCVYRSGADGGRRD